MTRAVLAFLVGLIVSSPAMAADIYYGISPSFYSGEIDDPNGPVESTSDGTIFSGSIIYQYQKSRRILVDASYFEYKLSSSTTNIGQEVETISLGLSHQHRFALLKNVSVWAGYGITSSTSEYTARHTIDNFGFLASTYPDRSETEFGLLLTVGNEFEISDDIQLGYMLGYLSSFSDGFEGIRFSISTYF